MIRLLFFMDKTHATGWDRKDFDDHMEHRYNSHPFFDSAGNKIPYTEWKEIITTFINKNKSGNGRANAEQTL